LLFFGNLESKVASSCQGSDAGPSVPSMMPWQSVLSNKYLLYLNKSNRYNQKMIYYNFNSLFRHTWLFRLLIVIGCYKICLDLVVQVRTRRVPKECAVKKIRESSWLAPDYCTLLEHLVLG